MDWEFSWTWVWLGLARCQSSSKVVLILTKASFRTTPWPSLLARTCLSSITCFKGDPTKAGMGLSYLHYGHYHATFATARFACCWRACLPRVLTGAVNSYNESLHIYNSSERVKQIVNCEWTITPVISSFMMDFPTRFILPWTDSFSLLIALPSYHCDSTLTRSIITQRDKKIRDLFKMYKLKFTLQIYSEQEDTHSTRSFTTNSCILLSSFK